MSEFKGYGSFEEMKADLERASAKAAETIDPRELILKARRGQSIEAWRELILLRCAGDDPVSNPEREKWWLECKELLDAEAPWRPEDYDDERRPEDYDDEPRVDGKSALDLFRENSLQ
jgi:hypothetical protein